MAKTVTNKPKLTRILSIDGGGIRGIIPGQILVSLEKMLQQKTGKRGLHISDCFDLIAGTSTGGILTCAILAPEKVGSAKPKFTAQEVVDLYLERGDEIFEIPLMHKIKSGGGILDEKYPADGLEEALQDYFQELWLSDLIKPCLITSYDIKRRRAHFFTQVDAKQTPSRNYRVRDVARATSAAPTYFECARVKSKTNITYPLVDGGTFANNPTLCAYAEVRDLFKKHATDIAILSLGTGHTSKSYSYKEAKNWGMAEWIKPVIDIMMAGVSETVDYQIHQIYEAVDKPDQYLRINPSLVGTDVNPDMDDATTENLQALRELGTETAQNYEEQLKKFIDLII